MGLLSEPLQNAMQRVATTGWYDIPTPWVTPAAGIITVQFTSANHGGVDAGITVNGTPIWEYHQAQDWGHTWSFVVPAGATITYYGSRGVNYARFMQIQ